MVGENLHDKSKLGRSPSNIKRAVMAESVARAAQRSSGREWGGGGDETVWLPVCLGGQFAKLKLKKNLRTVQSSVSLQKVQKIFNPHKF